MEVINKCIELLQELNKNYGYQTILYTRIRDNLAKAKYADSENEKIDLLYDVDSDRKCLKLEQSKTTRIIKELWILNGENETDELAGRIRELYEVSRMADKEN